MGISKPSLITLNQKKAIVSNILSCVFRVLLKQAIAKDYLCYWLKILYSENIKDKIALIHQFGGKAFLAHPNVDRMQILTFYYHPNAFGTRRFKNGYINSKFEKR